MTHIVIVGAGVIGLTNALVLAEATKSDITVIAKHLPGDVTHEYTSPWAGAHFRPFPSKNDKMWEESQLTRVTQRRFRRIAAEEPESTIRFIEAIEYFEDPDEYYRNISKGYSEEMKDFRVIPKSELPPEATFGTSYETWVVNVPEYLNYLYRKLRFKHAVRFVKQELKALRDINEYSPNAIIVNCSGTGLQYHGGIDPKAYPIRGQTLLISPPTDFNKTVTYQAADGMWTFCIPRPVYGGMILGGTKQLEDKLATPRQEDTEALIERGSKMFPFLMKTDNYGKKFFDIVKINVGFRPARDGGVNLSVENYQHNTVINAYGAGGMGYELSFGIAEATLSSVKLLLRDSRL